MTDAADFVRFMRMVEIDREPGGCWAWLGNKPGGRYGHFSVDGKTVKAHRWILTALEVDVPDDLVVRHRCDNPQCVNPQHLETGTYADNTADMHKRGRGPDRRGEKHPLVRLTESDVLAIRQQRACGEPETVVAKRFGVGRGQIGKITRRENWKHVP